MCVLHTRVAGREARDAKTGSGEVMGETMVDRPVVEWTEGKLREFKTVYLTAYDAGYEEFMFEGHLYVSGYAKYLIQYLDNYFSRLG